MPRLSSPRLAPVPATRWSPEQRLLMETQVRDGAVLNLYATMIRHPRIYQAWLGFMGYIFGQTSLPPRTREMLILRTGWLWNAEYEFAHHRPLALRAGMTEMEVDRVVAGPEAPGWSEEERVVLRAADELRHQAFITDETYAQLGDHFRPNEIIEIVYTVGGYAMTALAINSFGIEIEPGYAGYPTR
jgi:alkylhydroperoxidase family enzyme